MSKETSVSVVNPQSYEEISSNITEEQKRSCSRRRVVISVSVGFVIVVAVVAGIGLGYSDLFWRKPEKPDGTFEQVDEAGLAIAGLSEPYCLVASRRLMSPREPNLSKLVEKGFQQFEQQQQQQQRQQQSLSAGRADIPMCSLLVAFEDVDASTWTPEQVVLRDSLVAFGFAALKESENPYNSLIPIHVMSSPLQWYNFALGSASLGNVSRYKLLLEYVWGAFREALGNLRKGLAAGYKAYKSTISGPYESIAKLAAVQSAEDLGLVKPLVQMLRDLGTVGKPDLDQVLILANGILEAVRDTRDYLASTYIPAIQDAPVNIGGRVPSEFKTMYEDHLIRHFTNSRTATADDIHNVGLQEVDRIRARMVAIAKDATGSEDVGAFYASFAKSEENRFNSVQDMISHCYNVTSRVTPKLPTFFVDIPTSPMTIVPIPNTTAQPGTTASYRDGEVNVNANYYFLMERHLQAGIIVHEAYAGHHFHLSLCDENRDRHPFLLKTYGQTSFIEGWGLYTERLGEEMDVYVDNRELFGRLQSEMLRACRLVVDTGLHAKGWTRQQAVDFMNKNFAALPEEVEFEVDRYISIPGQALAYKMGELSIIETRQVMETKFGALFDLRKFHSRLLSQCSMPVSTIKRFFRDWNPSN